MPQQETDTFLLLIEEFCSPHIIITNHHIQLGELILDGYSNDSLTLTSTYESNQVASTCLHCLMTPTIHSTEDSIVYLKILSVLLPVVSVRHSLFNPESILIPVLFHSITHQPDPTDFIFETFAIFVKLLLDHPTEDLHILQSSVPGTSTALCSHCSWGSKQMCSYYLLEQQMEAVLDTIHMVIYTCLSGELLALTWCLITQLLKSPLMDSFLLHWHDLDCLESLFNLSTYEYMLSATYMGDSGLQWWLKAVYYLIRNPICEQAQDIREMESMRNDLIQLQLLRWWLAHNVHTQLHLHLSPSLSPSLSLSLEHTSDHARTSDTPTSAVHLHPAAGFSVVSSPSLSLSPCARNRTSLCIHSFTSQQSFLFLTLMRDVMLQAMDIFMTASNSHSFLTALSTYPVHQQLLYREVIENIQGITILCFELLEDAILLKNEVVIAICAEICCLSVQSIQHLLWTGRRPCSTDNSGRYLPLSPNHNDQDINVDTASTNNTPAFPPVMVTATIKELVCSICHNHYVGAVCEHLTMNLSKWDALMSGQTSIDSTLITELIDTIHSFKTATTSIATTS